MELAHVAVARSNDIAFDSLQFNEEIERLISPPPTENGSSFTALLELPPTQAVELLHSHDTSTSHSTLSLSSRKPHFHATDYEAPPLPLSSDPLGCTSSFSAFAGEKVKNEAVTESASKSSSPSEPVVSDPASENKGRQPGKRKERELKGKGSAKKSKTESSQDAQLLPYVHVRARRGQATDSHSLAERARREKINARMKLLQELVPGCSKISGTALVLDEIINHVQSLQRQVELLSMKLAAVNPRMDFNLDSIFAPEMGPLIDSGFPNMIMPLVWPEVHVNGGGEQFQQQWHFNPLHQQGWGKEEDAHNLMTPEVSLLSYDSSANTVSPHSDPLKMEL